MRERKAAPVLKVAVLLNPSMVIAKSETASCAVISPLKGYGMHVRL